MGRVAVVDVFMAGIPAVVVVVGCGMYEYCMAISCVGVC